jgi:hypothetical protein
MKTTASAQLPCGLNLKQSLFWRKPMKLRFLCSLLFLGPALLSGQDKGTGTPVPAYTELKQCLSHSRPETGLPQFVDTNGWSYGAVEAKRCQIFVRQNLTLP